MGVEISTLGKAGDQTVSEARLKSATGVEVTVLSYGARVTDWRVPTPSGFRKVVLGYPSLEEYLEDTSYLGAIVGRVTNRIAGAKFELGGKTFQLEASPNSKHYLHGGSLGGARRNWSMQAEDDGVSLTLKSPALEMGFPGSVDYTVTYRLKDFTLHISMSAQVSELTPINMTQHSYFNLRGHGDVRGHLLHVESLAFTTVDAELIPTGEIRRFDKDAAYGLSEPRDVNLVLKSPRDLDLPVATLRSSDLTLKLWTDQPGLQVYNGIHLAYAGVALEDQGFPDAIHHANFPSTLVRPEKPYLHNCKIEIR